MIKARLNAELRAERDETFVRQEDVVLFRLETELPAMPWVGARIGTGDWSRKYGDPKLGIALTVSSVEMQAGSDTAEVWFQPDDGDYYEFDWYLCERLISSGWRPDDTERSERLYRESRERWEARRALADGGT